MTFNMELTQSYLTLLREETLPAIGCTEPVAVALCAAEASACLLKEPYRLHLEVSPYILKNGMHVGIPGTAGLTGLDLACALGSLLPHPEKQMTILGDVSDEKLSKAKAIVQSGSVSVRSADTPYKVWVDVRIDAADGHWARAVIQGTHTHVLLVEKDGQPLRTDRCQESESRDMPAITLESVYAFATTVSQADLEFLDEIIRVNTRIACEGLARDYGLCVGRHLANSPDAAQQVIAVTAAAADARMSGCQLPVMTNMGSGNQGITASLPVIETAHLLGASREQLLRALAISELVAMEVKTHIGRLSALCGCSIAAAIGAHKAVFLTDVDGLYADWPDKNSLIGRIGVENLRDMLPDLESGMRPKMEACVRALDGGVPQAHIIDGRKPHSILNEIFTTDGIGTMVVPEDGIEMRSSYGN